MYSGITSGRVLNGELLYTKILEVNLFAFAYRLFRRDFSPLDGTYIYIYAIHMCSGITSGRVLNGELLYTKILQINLFEYPCNMSRRVGRNLYETVCRQMQTN